MNLAEVIRAWRMHKEINVRDAAKVFGLTTATYSRIERGEMMDGVALSKFLTWLIQESK